MQTPDRFYYLTCHREENTHDDAALSQILLAMESLPFPTLYPVHPRNRAAAERLRTSLGLANVRFLSPLGYLESVALVTGAERIVTDSGGVQREAFFAGVPCVTISDYAVWPETMVGGCNVLAKPHREDILQKLATVPVWPTQTNPFGDGHACEKIVSLLSSELPRG